MTNIVLQIEREQKARMERDKEEDDHHEEYVELYRIRVCG